MKNRHKIKTIIATSLLGIFFLNFHDIKSANALTSYDTNVSENDSVIMTNDGVTVNGQKLTQDGVEVQEKLSASTPVSSKKFSYTLLETFPGFFKAKDTMTDLPTLILAIYKFGIWTVGIAGLFMIVIGGIMYMTSAGNKSTAGSAKGVIGDAIYGIIGALTAYLFLYVINPDLVKINLNFTPVGVSEPEDVQVSGTMYTALTTRDGQQIDVSFDASLEKLRQSGIKTILTSGLRTVEKQKELISQNCGYPPTKTCSPTTCLLKNGPSSCPHTTGRAADVWALDGSGKQAITQAQCQANISACFNNSYQKALIAGMKKEGFCVLSSEPWHFEKPRMSSRCN